MSCLKANLNGDCSFIASENNYCKVLEANKNHSLINKIVVTILCYCLMAWCIHYNDNSLPKTKVACFGKTINTAGTV